MYYLQLSIETLVIESQPESQPKSKLSRLLFSVAIYGVNGQNDLHNDGPAPIVLPSCPDGTELLEDDAGRPRKCLPHQNNLCLDHVDNATLAESVCCWYNNVDYFCCMNVNPALCPKSVFQLQIFTNFYKLSVSMLYQRSKPRRGR